MARYCDRELTVAEALLDPRGRVRRRQRLQVRGAVGVRARPVHGGRCPRQRAAGKDHRDRRHHAAGQPRHPDAGHQHGQPQGLAVYGRFGKPCLRCSTPIEVRKHGEQARVTYWCRRASSTAPRARPRRVRRRARAARPALPVAAAGPWRRRRRAGRRPGRCPHQRSGGCRITADAADAEPASLTPTWPPSARPTSTRCWRRSDRTARPPLVSAPCEWGISRFAGAGRCGTLLDQ